MNTEEFATWAINKLNINSFESSDSSLNGLQVANSNKQISKIAFAVDACQETINRAKEQNADMLFVHHGLFWGKSSSITGIMYSRIKLLLDNDIALFACHLPLDAHLELGNNIQIAKQLDLQNIKPFGLYHGQYIGYQGEFLQEQSIEETCKKLLPEGDRPISVFPFGKKQIKTVAIISGDAASDFVQAKEQNIDLYITGESSHSCYNNILESKINFIAAGHYKTEVFGVKAVAYLVKNELSIDTIFIENPTGL